MSHVFLHAFPYSLTVQRLKPREFLIKNASIGPLRLQAALSQVKAKSGKKPDHDAI
jgi:hypothetical protein